MTLREPGMASRLSWARCMSQPVSETIDSSGSLSPASLTHATRRQASARPLPQLSGGGLAREQRGGAVLGTRPSPDDDGVRRGVARCASVDQDADGPPLCHVLRVLSGLYVVFLGSIDATLAGNRSSNRPGLPGGARRRAALSHSAFPRHSCLFPFPRLAWYR